MNINHRLFIPDNEIIIRATKSGGPGGQNVNKLNSAVHLRFNIPASSLPTAVKERLLAQNDRRVTRDGTLIIKAQQFRTFEKNREDALKRLADFIKKGTAREPLPRKLTRPTKASQKKRMEEKLRRSKIKKLRQKITF